VLMDGLIGEEDVGIGLAELRRQIAVQRRTGLKVSRICLGTMACGVQVDETQSRAILDHAAEAGVSFIDTADGYPLFGNTATVGMTEEILGRWLAGKRQNFTVATRCCATMGPNPMGPRHQPPTHPGRRGQLVAPPPDRLDRPVPTA